MIVSLSAGATSGGLDTRTQTTKRHKIIKSIQTNRNIKVAAQTTQCQFSHFTSFRRTGEPKYKNQQRFDRRLKIIIIICIYLTVR